MQKPDSMDGQIQLPRGAVLRTDGTARKAGLAAAGGMLGALAASSCCIVPLVLFSLGIGGAWIGILTALAPYQPILVGVTMSFLAAGYYLVYRNRAATCAEGTSCARSLPGVRLALWIATAAVLAAIAFPYVARLLLEA